MTCAQSTAKVTAGKPSGTASVGPQKRRMNAPRKRLENIGLTAVLIGATVSVMVLLIWRLGVAADQMAYYAIASA